MSLLNEALRKKGKEKIIPATDLFSSTAGLERSPAKRTKVLLILMLAILAGMGGSLWWLSAVQDQSMRPSLASNAPGALHTQKIPAAAAPQPAAASTAMEDAGQAALQPGEASAALEDAGQESPAPVTGAMEPAESQEEPASPPRPAPGDEKPLPQLPEAREKETLEPVKKAGPAPVEPSQPAPETVPAEMRTAAEENQGSKPMAAIYFEKARHCHRQNRLDEAEAFYRLVLEKEPRHKDALFHLAGVYLERQSFAEALPLLEKLRIMSAREARIAVNLAVAEIGLDRPDRALTYLAEAERNADGFLFPVFFHRGVALARLDRAGEALFWYRKAESLSPLDPGLLFNIAVCRDGQREYPDAIQYYLKFLQVTEKKDEKVIQRVRYLENWVKGEEG